MILYPAMDLMDGRVVRLRQGCFDARTAYATDPAAALAGFADAGAQWAHVVDLDGARAGEPVQHEEIGRLAAGAKLKLQIGGGCRSRDDAARLLDAGAARLVIGSLAVEQPGLVRALFDEFGAERIALSLDVRLTRGEPIVATAGWTRASELSLWDAVGLYPEARHILITDIGRDGMLTGPNFELLHRAADLLPAVHIQASGGISALDDLRQLRTAGAIVGKALWEGRFTLVQALDAVA
jgi:phosphoribosylformimino-5-aminoimidazole carboxamide ribotide isomerase